MCSRKFLIWWPHKTDLESRSFDLVLTLPVFSLFHTELVPFTGVSSYPMMSHKTVSKVLPLGCSTWLTLVTSASNAFISLLLNLEYDPGQWIWLWANLPHYSHYKTPITKASKWSRTKFMMMTGMLTFITHIVSFGSPYRGTTQLGGTMPAHTQSRQTNKKGLNTIASK